MTTTGTTAQRHTARFEWVREEDPRWDADRERVFATVPEGVFRASARSPGERLTSDWWRVQRDGRVIGYGWLDDVWGDAEILLAVEQDARRTGAGGFALDRLEREAAARGLNYVVNVVRETHPQREAVTAWFLAHGFTSTDDGRLRKQVRAAGAAAETEPAGGRVLPADDARRARYTAAREQAAARPRQDGDDPPAPDLGPGAEELGGYVDPEQHRY